MDFIKIPYKGGTLALNPAQIRSVYYQRADSGSSLVIDVAGDSEPIMFAGEEADRVWRIFSPGQDGAGKAWNW